MSLDLSPLLARAFFTDEAARATPAIAEARVEAGGGRSYEVILPPEPDLAWLDGTLMRKLVYFCEATRAPLPGCGDVFVTFFAGDRLACVHAADVVAFACDALAVTSEELVKRHGTGEVRHALREPPPR